MLRKRKHSFPRSWSGWRGTGISGRDEDPGGRGDDLGDAADVGGDDGPAAGERLEQPACRGASEESLPRLADALREALHRPWYARAISSSSHRSWSDVAHENPGGLRANRTWGHSSTGQKLHAKEKVTAC
jgi:hypothetical protein